MDSAIQHRPARRILGVGRTGWVAGTIVAVVAFVAVFGSYFAPHNPDALIGIPYTGPSSTSPLGTDFLGRDVLSRLLCGGRSVVILAGLATILGYTIGATVGLLAGYRGGLLDAILMRSMDVVLAFPPILFLLILATGAGASQVALVLGIATIHVPSVARILRTAALQTVGTGYVEAAVARGERTWWILRNEVLPNIGSVVVADAGPRFTVSVLLVAALSFLGLGLQPPAADWALMISENRLGLTSQPLAVAAPAAVIALLTVSINILGDAIAHSRDRSIDLGAMRR